MSDSYLVDSLPIHINGNEKFATGLTKRTTIDDVKYAILSCTLNCTTEALNLNDYAIFERWQGNERILDGNLKIYKLIRLWKSLPGNQLDSVKFIIKKRKNVHMKLAHNTASPSMCKTWNSNKAANALRKSSVKRDKSSSSIESSNESSNDEINRYDKRYSSIRKFNRVKRSTVCKNEDRREAFIDLVSKQNEIIEKQQHKLENSEKLIKKYIQTCVRRVRSSVSTARSKSLDKGEQENKITTKQKSKRLSSKSRERSSSIRRLVIKDDIESLNVTSDDIQKTFENVLDDKQMEEYANLCNNYFNIQKNVNLNKNKIDKLNNELATIKQQTTVVNNQLTNDTTQKIQASVQTYDKQSEKMSHLNDALNRIDEIILLKSNLIRSLESELKKIEDEQLFDIKPQTIQQQTNNKKLTPSSSTSSTISSFSSSSSILTSVSEQGVNKNNINTTNNIKTTFGDNDSDTGISSANSEDFTSQLETLV
jgi:hypothetical protein